MAQHTPESSEERNGASAKAPKTLQWVYRARNVFNWVAVSIDTAVMASLAIVLSFFEKDGERSYHAGRWWSLMNLYGIGGRWKVLGLEKVDRNEPYVVMVNHSSHLDVWAIFCGLPLQIRWVMKQELRKVPIFGLACERMGHIYVQRGNSAQAKRSMQLAARRVANGASVVFFPEGTRSQDGTLQRFKKGGFRLAIESGVPILPVTISGTREMLPAGRNWAKPGRIWMVIGDPIPTTGKTLADMEELMEKTRAAIEAGRVSSTG
jgi:1-acyl-sn-glycerol-3-phosphate acyltransferase